MNEKATETHPSSFDSSWQAVVVIPTTRRKQKNNKKGKKREKKKISEVDRRLQSEERSKNLVK